MKHAKKYVEDVEFYAEDAGRADNEYLARVIEAVIKAGATVVNIPDTTGYCLPQEYGRKIKYLMENVGNIHKAIISTHCHNDLGMATANTLEAVINGARQAEVTINGIGERAGNTSLEEVGNGTALPQALECRYVDQFEIVDFDQPHGSQHDEHAGTGQQGDRRTQRLRPLVGNPPGRRAEKPRKLRDHQSGRCRTGRIGDRPDGPQRPRALNHRLELLGFKLEQKELDEVYAKFLELADKKKDVRDDDLLYLVGAATGEKVGKRIKLKYLQILTGTLIPTATVIVKIGDSERTATCTGNGPVDAAVKAIKTLINETVQITEFLIQAMNKGSDDVGRVHVQVKCGSMLVHGFSANTDVVKRPSKLCGRTEPAQCNGKTE